jgi:ubiquinone/menaquinone biosynthesis C-methylase UbiE
MLSSNAVHARFDDFCRHIQSEVYSEPDTELHTALTQVVMRSVFDALELPKNAVIADIGCGQGVALEAMAQRGYRPLGVTLSEEDVAACKLKGFDCYQMDQTFLAFDDNTIDFIWCRHALEHSPFPYFTLLEFRRVLKPGGLAYLEMPRPDDHRTHENNPNHYSILGKRMWKALFTRSGFQIRSSDVLSFSATDNLTKEDWKENYLQYVIQKDH